MGHNTLAVIPRSVKWRHVVGLMESGATDSAIIAASADAAEMALLGAADDPVFVEAVRLLLVIPAAARDADFAGALRREDLPVRQNPELLDLIVAATSRLDAVRLSAGRRTDLGELAGRALAGSLTQWIGDQLGGLFEATPDDLRRAAQALSRPRGISDLARGFFTDLSQAAISSWLERAIADQSAPGERFHGNRGRSEFDGALRAYAHESTRIIKEFAPGWYGKTLHERGTISSPAAASFGAVCLKKIVEELRVRRAEHA